MPPTKKTPKKESAGIRRTTYEIPECDHEVFLAMAKREESNISALFQSRIGQFGQQDIKKFDFELLSRINALQPQKIVTFRLSPEVDAQLKEVRSGVNAVAASKMGPRKVQSADIVRYIIHQAVEEAPAIPGGGGVEVPQKILVAVTVPEADYQTICTFAKARGTTVNRLFAIEFPRFTDSDYYEYCTKIDTGRKTDPRRYSNPDNDPRGPWTTEPVANKHPSVSGSYYDIIHPSTGEAVPRPKGGWRYTEARMAQLDKESRILWPDRKKGIIYRKKFLSEVEAKLCRTSFNIHASMYPELKEKSERLKEFLPNVLRVFMAYLADRIHKQQI